MAVDDPIPLLFGELVDRIAASQTGVIDQDVEAAKGLNRGIDSTLGAFHRDDGQAAFSDASPMIQEMFHDPGTFMEMVKTGYLPVYRSSHVEFRDLGMIDGKLIQQVYMVGPDGVAVLALYEMQRQPDGSWRINGCSIARAPDQGV